MHKWILLTTLAITGCGVVNEFSQDISELGNNIANFTQLERTAALDPYMPASNKAFLDAIFYQRYPLLYVDVPYPPQSSVLINTSQIEQIWKQLTPQHEQLCRSSLSDDMSLVLRQRIAAQRARCETNYVTEQIVGLGLMYGLAITDKEVTSHFDAFLVDY